jgi:phosphate transport system protein
MQWPNHISQEFEHELEDIRTRVLAMGGLVEQHLSQAIEAIAQSKSELADEVAESDYKVNSLEVAIDEECTEILARRQPAARDLRLVLAVIRVVRDLERVGDEAAKIGRLAVQLIEAESPKSYYINVLSMANRVRGMLHDVLDAFARHDVDAAVAIAREDSVVDRESDAIMRQLITYMMEDPRSISAVLDVMWVVRSLERVGDHVDNLCESIIYLVKGKDVRHISPEDMAREVQSED